MPQGQKKENVKWVKKMEEKSGRCYSSQMGCVEEMHIFPYFWIIYFYFHMWIYGCVSEPLVLLQDYFLVVDLKPHYSKSLWEKNASNDQM